MFRFTSAARQAAKRRGVKPNSEHFSTRVSTSSAKATQATHCAGSLERQKEKVSLAIEAQRKSNFSPTKEAVNSRTNRNTAFDALPKSSLDKILADMAQIGAYPHPLAQCLNPAAKVFVFNSHDVVNHFVSSVFAAHDGDFPSVVGLDVEFWMDKPATIQVAFSANLVAIFQIYGICGTLGRPLDPRVSNKLTFPSRLKSLLESSNVRKCGVGIQHDCSKIRSLLRFQVQNIFDCQDAAKSLKIGARSLVSLYYSFVDDYLPFKRVHKTLTGFSWELPELDTAAVEYAANDALASLLVYQEMMNQFDGKDTKKLHGASKSSNSPAENWEEFRSLKLSQTETESSKKLLPSNGGQHDHLFDILN